jgi:hypothetical protein
VQADLNINVNKKILKKRAAVELINAETWFWI